MTDSPTAPPHVIIAGGGIAGMALALSLHQIGVRCTVFEAVPEIRPLGVGINLQPNAVRELFDLGIGAEALDRIGVPIREWALVGLNGNDIHAEPRGLEAGYNWPQYAVHRGQLQMLLLDCVRARLGHDAVQTGARVTGYAPAAGGGVTVSIRGQDGALREVSGALLVAADGLHSMVRAQMYPDQPPIQWGGAILWRGVTRARPIRGGASFIGLGTHRHRMVIYPISRMDAEGFATINWIAEQTIDNTGGWEGDWNRKVTLDRFAHHFDGWCWDWLDVPALLEGAEQVYEYPMIDRDPLPSWVQGPVALMGDAAHVMYPTGSNGASQAIIDARVISAEILRHGVTPAALAAYDARLCAPVSALTLRNRGAGPFGLLDLVDARCGGRFEQIDSVIPPAEREAYLAGYKAAAGFAIEALNAAGPTVPPGARLAG